MFLVKNPERNEKSGKLSCYKEQQLVPSKPSIGVVPFGTMQLVQLVQAAQYTNWYSLVSQLVQAAEPGKVTKSSD